jgi:hypothetical protein
MTHLRPGSHKLWQRAVALVAELGGVDETRARQLLEDTGGSPAQALRQLRAHSSASAKGPS